jgi:hypothetical protein
MGLSLDSARHYVSDHRTRRPPSLTSALFFRCLATPSLTPARAATATDLHTYFPYYDRLTAVRTSKLWVQQGEIAGWLINSPQVRVGCAHAVHRGVWGGRIRQVG